MPITLGDTSITGITSNLGIGIESPTGRTHIVGNDVQPGLVIDGVTRDIGFPGNLQIGSWDGTIWQEHMRVDGSGNVPVGATSNAYGRLTVNGGKFAVNTQGGGEGVDNYQVITGSTTAAASNVFRKCVHVGNSNSLQINVIAQNGNSVASLVGVMSTRYGSSARTVLLSGFQNSGPTTFSGIEIQYDNGGSPNYTFDIRVTYSGSTPTLYWSVTGISRANMYNV